MKLEKPAVATQVENLKVFKKGATEGPAPAQALFNTAIELAEEWELSLGRSEDPLGLENAPY